MSEKRGGLCFVYMKLGVRRHEYTSTGSGLKRFEPPSSVLASRILLTCAHSDVKGEWPASRCEGVSRTSLVGEKR